MKRVYLILFAVLCLSKVSANTDSLYQRANELYQEGEYELALNAYREILTSGYESPGLYYNMGNASFRSNSIGYAILYYEKVLKLDPSHEDAKHNLEFVSRYRVDAFEPVPELFLRNWIRVLVQALPERSWSLLAMLLFGVLLAGVLVYLFSHKLNFKKAGFLTAVLGLLLFLVALTAAISSHKKVITPDEGIILAPSVIVRSSPSDSGTELFVLHEGTKIKVNEEVAGWQNIRIMDGREGWIGTSDFGSI